MFVALLVLSVCNVLVSHVAVYHGFDVVSYGVVLCDIVVGWRSCIVAVVVDAVCCFLTLLVLVMMSLVQMLLLSQVCVVDCVVVVFCCDCCV